MEKKVIDWAKIIIEILIIIRDKLLEPGAAIAAVALKYNLPIDEVKKHFNARKK